MSSEATTLALNVLSLCFIVAMFNADAAFSMDDNIIIYDSFRLLQQQLGQYSQLDYYVVRTSRAYCGRHS